MILRNDTPDSTVLTSCGINENSYAGFNRLFFATPGFTFSSKTNFETLSQWTTALTAGSINQLDGLVQVSDQSEQPQYYKSRNGQQVLISPGRIIHEYAFAYTNAFHKIIRAFDQGLYEVFLSDRNRNIYGTTDDLVSVRGFRVNQINVQKRLFGTQQKVFSVIRVEYADFVEWDKYGIISNVDWINDRLITS